jgi:hypothetical protein
MPKAQRRDLTLSCDELLQFYGRPNKRKKMAKGKSVLFMQPGSDGIKKITPDPLQSDNESIDSKYPESIDSKYPESIKAESSDNESIKAESSDNEIIDSKYPESIKAESSDNESIDSKYPESIKAESSDNESIDSKYSDGTGTKADNCEFDMDRIFGECSSRQKKEESDSESELNPTSTAIHHFVDTTTPHSSQHQAKNRYSNFHQFMSSSIRNVQRSFSSNAPNYTSTTPDADSPVHRSKEEKQLDEEFENLAATIGNERVKQLAKASSTRDLIKHLEMYASSQLEGKDRRAYLREKLTSWTMMGADGTKNGKIRVPRKIAMGMMKRSKERYLYPLLAHSGALPA